MCRATSASEADASASNHPPCTALIVTYQSARQIPQLLDALDRERHTGLDLDVVVVDNDSRDRTPDVVRGYDWVRFVPSGGNLGYAAAINIGSRLVSQDRAILVLNPDVVPLEGSLGRLLDGLAFSGVGVVAPRLETMEGQLSKSLRHEPSIGRALVDALLGDHASRLPCGASGIVWPDSAYVAARHCEWATGAALLISPDCRSAVGDWDERYFLYCEETDYLRRVRATGLHVRYEPTSVVRHVGGASGVSDGLHARGAVSMVRYYRRYHGPIPSMVFRGMIMLHQLVRWRRSESGLALRALLSRSVQATLPAPSFPSGQQESLR